MMEILRLQELETEEIELAVAAISWSSCDKGSCNKTTETIFGSN